MDGDRESGDRESDVRPGSAPCLTKRRSRLGSIRAGRYLLPTMAHVDVQRNKAPGRTVCMSRALPALSGQISPQSSAREVPMDRRQSAKTKTFFFLEVQTRQFGLKLRTQFATDNAPFLPD